jgi:hypothetical protein
MAVCLFGMPFISVARSSRRLSASQGQSWVALTDTTHLTICEGLQASSNIAFDVCQTGKGVPVTTLPRLTGFWSLSRTERLKGPPANRGEPFANQCLVDPKASRLCLCCSNNEVCEQVNCPGHAIYHQAVADFVEAVMEVVEREA